MNEQTSDRIAANNFATSSSNSSDTEELFSEIPGTVSEPPNLRLRNDTTVFSDDNARPGHRSHIDTCAEADQSIQANRHIASFSDDDRFAKQSQRLDSDENDNSIRNSSPQCNSAQIEQRAHQTCSISDNNSNSNTRTCASSSDTQDCAHSEHCSGRIGASNASSCKVFNKFQNFQPIMRAGLAKRSRRSHGIFLGSRVSSADDVLSVISEESLSSSDNKSQNGVHRSGSENTTPRKIELNNRLFRSHGDSKENRATRLDDPWIRSAEHNPSGLSTGATNPNPNDSNVISKNSDRQTDPTTPITETHSRLRFQTASEDQFQNTSANERPNHGISSNQCSKIEYENRQKERSDIDILSRPSWCDAKFALSRIVQVNCIKN